MRTTRLTTESPLDGTEVPMAAFLLQNWVPVSIGLMAVICTYGAIGYAGESLKIDGLSNDTKQFRIQVE